MTAALPTVWDLLGDRVRRDPGSPAISAPGRRDLSFHGLLEQICAATAALSSAGLGRTSRIAIALPPGPECSTAVISTMCACISVPLNPAYSAHEFQSAFVSTRISALVTRPGHVPEAVLAAQQAGIPVLELEPFPAEAGRFRLHFDAGSAPVAGTEPAPGDIAAIFSTSGTTAQPKLIPLTHSVICYRALRARNFVDLSPADRCLDLLPYFHGDAILISILGSLLAGGSSVYAAMPATQDLTRTIRDLAPTWCALPPPVVEKLLSGGIRWPGNVAPASFRAFFTCGAPVSAETVAGIEQMLGIPLQNAYGASECGGIAANPMPPGVRKRGSVGKSIGPDLAVLDEAGHPLPPNEAGEVAVRGPGVFSGYENAVEPRGEAFAGDWYRTGDCGFLDSDGYLFLTGRLRETINRGGEKIVPEEVETALRQHPSIAQAVAFPLPDATLGQDIAALAVARDPRPTPAELRDFVAQHLAAFKVPRAIVFVNAIPSGPTGKVRRNELASQFATELAAAIQSRASASDPPRTPVEKALAAIWSRLLALDTVGTRDRFFDLGGNSLLAVNMLSEAEAKFGRSIPMASFWQSPTIENLAAILIAAEQSKSSLMLPVQTSGARPPLFCVLPGWFVSETELLSRYLGSDQPVYALIPDPRPGAGQSGLTPAEIVAECVAAVESVSPTGPYCVIGRSAAGLVALAIAQHLRDKGRAVPLVGMLDTHYPGVTRQRLLPAPLKYLEYLLGEFVALPRSEWTPYLRRLPARAIRAGWRKFRGQRLPAQLANAAFYTRLHWLFDHEPEPWPGRLVLFAAESSRHRGFLDRRLYWSRAAEHGLEVHLVPGDHNMMVQEPHIRRFAAVLQGCLDRAHGDFSS